ncbi:tripartite tricarboxylate transporter TctB family protein [Falsiroseomonas oryziterrae]|uniref:tripartite tricarboxylate transporter TctB family protein n=1 Tax=Falsiroseomonas oryziterrae TaxID=2911368 RepID=UPI001F44E1B4|nr:tripartite tricarboxylate transporter TctB family protein [Roseomonas sp. NPKOSM-4]
MARRLDRDVLAGIALAGLGGYVAWRAAGWDLLTEDGPGPGFFPLGYGVLMVALSALLVLRTLLQPRPDAENGDVAGHARALATWAAFAGAAFAMQWIGFVAGFALLSAVVVVFVFGRGWARGAAVGAASAGVFWLVFERLMGVGLPAGPWGF